MTTPFLICLHDATPAYARETRAIIAELSPLVGRMLSVGVVPDWHGEWPLRSHRDYCRMIQDSSDEILLHGLFHQRENGRGLVSAIAEGCDEMNGMDVDGTRSTIERGQAALIEAFGERARGFVAPGWQPGRVRACAGIEYVFGYFALEVTGGKKVRLATSTWDCGRWGWLGHVGHGLGLLLQSVDHGIPVLAIHPRDIERRFWPKILRMTEQLLDHGCAPSTPARIVTTDVEVAV